MKCATSSNLGIFCRSPGYRKSEGEICCNLSPDQFKNLVQRLKFDILSNNSITDETCHHIIEEKLNIPKGILSLGKEGIQNYLRDLRSGEHKVFVARGMLVGCEGAGKTSLLLRLQGKDNPDPQSTRGLDVHVNMLTVNEDRLDVTANQNKPSLLSNLNTEEDPSTNQAEQGHGDQTSTKTRFEGSVREKRIEKSASFIETPLNIQENNEQVSEVAENSKTKENENVIPDGTVSGNKGSTTTEPSKVNDEDVETIDFGPLSTDDANISPETDMTFQILSESFTDNDRKIITFFDFAGQFAYYACHHIYFSPNDFYILVMDITKKFDHMVYKDRAQQTAINKDAKTEEEINKMERSVYSGWTYLEFTEYWLQSILSHTVGLTPNEKIENSDGMDRAPLILVATHAEGISRKEGEAYFRDLRDRLPKLSAHVDYGKAFSTGFDDDLQEIKNCILNIVQTLPNWGKIFLCLGSALNAR
ncbi:uncharacterized protein LOC134279156 [Saccostrea cucullata]|uniref:uncharacterized protein LOC134279156 n=1 Tax=Saccostrea cuccullata TaxID=36930 RepID=UPI002ED153E4